VLYRHFAQRPALPAPSSLVPAEPQVRPAAPAPDAPVADWLEYHRQMVAWLEWQADIERWRDGVEHRLQTLEEGISLLPDILERLGPVPLSPEQQRTVQTSVNRLHTVTGRSHAALYDALRQAFHVGTYKEIPAARWPEVAAWFRAQLDRAGASTPQNPDQPSLF
jgi:hypothetical protein